MICYGRISLTTPFLHQAAERGIEVVLLTETGGLGARLASPTTSDPQIRRAQYTVADNPARSLLVAAGFVTGKLLNMREAVLRAADAEDAEALDDARSIDSLADRVSAVDDAHELLGLEGRAARRSLYVTICCSKWPGSGVPAGGPRRCVRGFP
ncbi:CRISPR-associated endonuclease Cas1 [Frankia canadensis]|uniref:CRISPR-associated endonuclease Cas1 n=1 Tax=Frankia canadensis TaxID=1836972 RepID=UPI0014039CCB